MTLAGNTNIILFSKFSSLYNADDTLFRMTTIGQMTGVMLSATGVPQAFEMMKMDTMVQYFNVNVTFNHLFQKRYMAWP